MVGGITLLKDEADGPGGDGPGPGGGEGGGEGGGAEPGGTGSLADDLLGRSPDASAGPVAVPPAPPSGASSDGPAEEISPRRIRLVFLGLMLTLLLAALDQMIVATALPKIVGELHGLDKMSWAVTAYLLASTIGLPLYGKLGDLFGRKGVFQFAIVVFV
ncbi:MFS transporter, partial [Streptomyces sp. NRRL WC-3549]|uniref:MFS transporter n=1 Tax=Streptomyces sp. NRRL WC-3549 TaxID=1463925 RepID=UPI0004C9EF63